MSGTVRSRKRRVSTRHRSNRARPQPRTLPRATYKFTIEILGYSINVFSIREFTDPGQVGMFDPDSHEIYIKEGLQPQAEFDTLFHEITHAVSSIGMPPDTRMNENQVTLLSTIWTDTINRNPALRAYITTHLETA